LKPIGVFAVRQAAIGVPEGRMYAPHIVDLTLSFTGVSAAKRATPSFARTLPQNVSVMPAPAASAFGNGKTRLCFGCR
jgi:hypothetical protein